jgi:hypothetical protein
LSNGERDLHHEASPPADELFEGVMLTVRLMTAADAVLLLLETPPGGGLRTVEWEAIRQRHSLLAFTAAEGEVLAGFVLAKSHPGLVHVVQLEGSAEARRYLLERLARAADRRPLSVWCPHPGDDLRDLLEGSGFTSRERGLCCGRPSLLYVLDPTGERV